METKSPDIHITRHKKTRFWAICIGQELLAVVCYKKRALAIRKALLDAYGAKVCLGRSKNIVINEKEKGSLDQ